MFAAAQNPSTLHTSTPAPLGAFAKSEASTSEDEVTTKIQYWSGLVLSKQLVPYKVTSLAENAHQPRNMTHFTPITFMAPFQSSSFEELRLAYYFYDLNQGGADPSGAAKSMQNPSKRSWEQPAILPVPRPTGLSTLGFPVVLPAPLSTNTLTTVNLPESSLPEKSTASSKDTSPFPALVSVLPSGPFQPSASQNANPTEGPPVQAFASLGLTSQSVTPTRPVTGGLFGKPIPYNPFTFPRSPAAQRIPAVNNAEMEWESARRAVIGRKMILERAQAEYEEAVQVEREKFKAYSNARMNLDK